MAGPDFSRRATTPELMDTEDCDFETFRRCLVDLAFVNRLTLAYRPTLAFLDRLVREGRIPAGRPLSIVDVGSGYGDMLRRIEAWARRRGVAVRLSGVDLNPWSERAAREASGPDSAIEWRTGDVFRQSFDGPVDLVVSSLFTHHLGHADLVRFVAWMEEITALGWFVNDLHRHAIPYHVFSAASRGLRLHRFVQHDGPVSIARSFSKADWVSVLTEAGLDPRAAQIGWWTPFRLCVARTREP